MTTLVSANGINYGIANFHILTLKGKFQAGTEYDCIQDQIHEYT